MRQSDAAQQEQTAWLAPWVGGARSIGRQMGRVCVRVKEGSNGGGHPALHTACPPNSTVKACAVHMNICKASKAAHTASVHSIALPQ